MRVKIGFCYYANMMVQPDPEVKKRVQAWIEGPFDDETKAEIQRMISQNPKELSSAFFKDLSFGTGGMRGLVGVGTNRMNIYTVRAATQGLASYIKQQPEPETGHQVFIGYDVRIHSRLFAEEAGRVLAGNGIKVLISREICPTPLVSFACRYFQCGSGIVITASHNPPQYNGYKVYWSDGGQVVPPHDAGIMEEVRRAQPILLSDLDSPFIYWVGRELDEAYLKELKKIQLLNQIDGRSLKIVYTNLHGTGIRIIPEALKQQGFTTLSLVDEQAAPDGTFKNAPSPNPEETEALQLGTRKLMEMSGDLLLATDPDADRVGVVVRVGERPIRLTGNQIACLCLYHICACLSEKGEFPENAGFIKTIVTTELFKLIATDFGGVCIDVLTGFKYISEIIRQWEASFGGLQFLFGAEESYGYLFGTFVRDKDAISSCCLIAEAAAFAKMNNRTLVDQLYEIYRRYGVHRESLTNLSFSNSPAGIERVGNLMQTLRSHPPHKIGDLTVVLLEDFADGSMSLPKSNVLRFWLSDRSKLVIRPSGTEPKIKIYVEVVGKVSDSIESETRSCDERILQLIEAFRSIISWDT